MRYIVIRRVVNQSRDNTNGHKKKDKMTNNDLQNTTQKSKDRTPLKTRNASVCSWRVSSSCSTNEVHVLLEGK